MNNKKKIVLAMVAVVALVSILAICLCACAKKTTELPQTPEEFKAKLESKGYETIISDELASVREGIVQEYLFAVKTRNPDLPLTAADAQYLEWHMYACKNSDDDPNPVEIYKFANEEVAKKWYQCFLLAARYDDPDGEYYGAEVRGTIVFFQSLAGIRDAIN